jgi:hypothetical protein
VAIIKRILSYEGTSPLITINTYKDVKGKLKQVTSKMLLDHLHAVVCFIGEDVLGYKASKIGTYSLHQVRSCNGNVLVRNTSVHHHVDWKMVK